MKKENDLSLYYEVRDQMEIMGLLDWQAKKGSSVISDAIHFVTGSKSNHTGSVGFMQTNRRRVVTLHAIGSGCKPQPLSYLLKNFKGQVYYHPVKDEYKQYSGDAFEWMYNKIGTPYGYGDVVQNMWKKVNANARFMFCTEYYFLGWRDGVAYEMHIPELSWLLNIKKAPVPPEMPKLGVNVPVGIPLLKPKT